MWKSCTCKLEFTSDNPRGYRVISTYRNVCYISSYNIIRVLLWYRREGLNFAVWWLLTDWWNRGLRYKGLNLIISMGGFCTEDFRAAARSQQMLGGVSLDQLYISSGEKKERVKEPGPNNFFFCISTASLIVNTCTPGHHAMHLNSSLPSLWDMRVILPCQSSEVGSVSNQSSRCPFLSATSFLLL